MTSDLDHPAEGTPPAGVPALQVKFSGCPTRSGPLTRGQRNTLVGQQRTGAQIALIRVLEMHGRLSPGRAAECVGELMERHEALRTIFTVGNQPTQKVLSDGAFPVTVRDVAPADTAQAAGELGRELAAPFFDNERDLPLRLGLVTAGAAVSRAVIVISHMAADAVAISILVEELADLTAGKILGAAHVHPLDVAAMESRAAWQRRAAASVAYWQDQLRRAPHNVFLPLPSAGQDDGTSALALRSAAAAARIAAVARRSGATASAVVLTAMSVVAQHFTGDRCFVMTLISANRASPAMRRYVGTATSDTIMTVDLDHCTSFDEAVHEVGQRALLAYRNGCQDAAELWRAIAEIDSDRGVVTHPRAVVYNDMSFSGLPLFGQAREPVRTDADGTVRYWLRGSRKPSCLDLSAYRIDEEFVATFWGDPTVLSAADIERFVDDLLAVLEAAGEDDFDLEDVLSWTECQATRPRPGWVHSDGGWVEPARIRRMLGDVLGPIPVFLDLVPDKEMGTRLVCHIADQDRVLIPASLHRSCLTALEGRIGVMAPHHYVLHDRATRDLSDGAEWRRLRPRAADSGRNA